jgi:hypothetical protein
VKKEKKDLNGQDDLEKAAQEALGDLDSLEKSLSGDKEEKTGIDELEKAIADADDALKKSGDEEGDKGDSDKEDEENEEMEKSLEDLDPDVAEELVKASEAYEALEKSVNERGKKTDSRLEGLAKSVQTLTKLAIGQAKVIASLTKSLEKVGEKPMKKSGAQIGVGGTEEPMVKSKGEVRAALEKALREGKDGVPPNLLSFLDSYGVEATLARIPEATLGELGLK